MNWLTGLHERPIQRLQSKKRWDTQITHPILILSPKIFSKDLFNPIQLSRRHTYAVNPFTWPQSPAVHRQG